MDWTAIWLTLRLAACTAALLLLIGVPIACWIATSRRWWRPVVEAAVALPIILPPTVLGFYVLVASGPHGALGAVYERLTGRLLPFSFQAILIGSVLYNLPFAVRPFATSFAAVDRRLVEASWCLGASRVATFFRVTVPLSWAGILTGVILAFAHTVGEFGVVLMLGGNIPGVTRTVSISIYDNVQAMNYAAAGRTSLAMLLFSFAVLSLTYALQRRVMPV